VRRVLPVQNIARPRSKCQAWRLCVRERRCLSICGSVRGLWRGWLLYATLAGRQPRITVLFPQRAAVRRGKTVLWDKSSGKTWKPMWIRRHRRKHSPENCQKLETTDGPWKNTFSTVSERRRRPYYRRYYIIDT